MVTEKKQFAEVRVELNSETLNSSGGRMYVQDAREVRELVNCQCIILVSDP